MSRTTKLELEQINARLAAENAALRSQLDERNTMVAALRAENAELSAAWTRWYDTACECQQDAGTFMLQRDELRAENAALRQKLGQ